MNIKKSRKITYIHGRQIFDSRGIPTVEAIVGLDDGSFASAQVPSGASTGKYEAFELRDGDEDYMGKSVYAAVNAVDTVIKNAIIEKDATEQFEIDYAMIKADGEKNKSRLGANAILAVSLAVASAAAKSYSLPLYRYLGGSYARLMPLPLMNILNGGAHASNNLDIQEFMIAPVGANSFAEAMKMGVETYHALKSLLKADGLSVSVGDEGGFAPSLSSDDQALGYITDAIEKAGYTPSKDISLALDVAASEWYQNGSYVLPKAGKRLSPSELSSYYKTLLKKYPIISIEDPFGEEDFDSFAEFTKENPALQIVGDDLFVTNTERIKKGASLSCGNAVLIKPNQIGTLSETLDAISCAHENSYNAVVSHRSGETCDTSIADIAVATNAGQIKTGAPCRGERLAKYNRLLRIEELLGNSSKFGIFS